MIASYLLDHGRGGGSETGYIDSSNLVQKETGLSLDKWEVADNISLYYVLQDYEEYQEIRLNKRPKLVRKLNEKITLPKIKAKPPMARKPSSVVKGAKPVAQSDTDEPANGGAGLLLVGRPHLPGREESEPQRGSEEPQPRGIGIARRVLRKQSDQATPRLQLQPRPQSPRRIPPEINNQRESECAVWRRRRAHASQAAAERSSADAHEVPAFVHRPALTMEGHSAIRPPWHRQNHARQGSGHRMQDYLFQYLC